MLMKSVSITMSRWLGKIGPIGGERDGRSKSRSSIGSGRNGTSNSCELRFEADRDSWVNESESESADVVVLNDKLDPCVNISEKYDFS